MPPGLRAAWGWADCTYQRTIWGQYYPPGMWNVFASSQHSLKTVPYTHSHLHTLTDGTIRWQHHARWESRAEGCWNRAPPTLTAYSRKAAGPLLPSQTESMINANIYSTSLFSHPLDMNRWHNAFTWVRLNRTNTDHPALTDHPLKFSLTLHCSYNGQKKKRKKKAAF